MAAEVEVKESFESYMRAFSDGDYPAVASLVSLPAIVCQASNTMEITSSEVVQGFMQQLRASLPENYASTDITQSNVTMLSDSLAALHGVYERHTESGGLISRNQGLYVFRQDGSGWKMCCITVMADPPA